MRTREARPWLREAREVVLGGRSGGYEVVVEAVVKAGVRTAVMRTGVSVYVSSGLVPRRCEYRCGAVRSMR